jgi:hypothetical protein
MNKKVVISLAAVLLVVGLLVFLLDTSGGERARTISSNWASGYVPGSPEPKGIGFFGELLETYNRDTVYYASTYKKIDSLKLPAKASYVFVGDDMALLANEVSGLRQLADSGATVFLAFNQYDPDFYAAFFKASPFYWEYTSRAFVAFGDTSLAYCPVFQNDTVSDDWYTFNPEALQDSTFTTLAYSMNKPVTVSLKQGKGRIILHSMPQLFMNYQVLKPNGFMHARFILKKLDPAQPVVWLEFARFDRNRADMDTGDQGDSEKEDRSFIKFIMQNAPLRWAFVLAIGILLLYVFFRAKRRQEVLPGIPEKRNMSLAFVETLSSIYLSRNSPYGILLVLRKNFYSSVNRHFYIDLNQADAKTHAEKYEANVKRLIEKSRFDEEELRSLLAALATRPAKSHEITSEALSKVYAGVRKFYLAAGINKPVSQFGRDQERIVRRIPIAGLVLALLSVFAILRGVYGLAKGGEFSIIVVILGVLLLVLAIRLLTTPVAKLSRKEIVVYHPFLGKKKMAVTPETTYQRTKSGIVFYDPDGNSVTIGNALVTHKGLHNIKLFTEHLKKRSL